MSETFASVQDVAAFLQVEIEEPAQLASAQRALVEATAAIRIYCRQFLTLVEDEEIALDGKGGTRLFLPQLPVVGVASVVEDGETLVVDEDYVLGDYGILYRLGGYRWVAKVRGVTVTYSHGYEELPEGIVAVATRAAARAYQSGLRAVAEEGVIGVTQKQLGDFSVSYGNESVAEGTMGASAARMLLLSEKDILNEYRV